MSRKKIAHINCSPIEVSHWFAVWQDSQRQLEGPNRQVNIYSISHDGDNHYILYSVTSRRLPSQEHVL